MRRTASFLIVVAASALTACNGSSADPVETASAPSAAPSTTADNTPTTPAPSTDSPSTSSSTDTTTAETPTTPPTSETEPSTTVDPAPSDLPDDLGPRLDSVPGVDSAGEIIEIADMVALFIPSEPDDDDANVAVPLPEDVEIIVAYARAMTALYGQVTQDSIPVEPSEEMQATFLDGGEKYSQNVFAPRNEAGEHLEFFGDPDVLRPVVLADPRSANEAFIFDCALSASRYVDADGALVDGQTPGTELAPLIVRLVRVDGGWIVDDIQDDERACR